MQFTLINQDGERNLTVFAPGREPLVAHESHPNFDEIVEGIINDDDSVLSLFDLSATAAAAFKPLSERVSIAYGRVYFDGDEVDNSLTKQIVRFVTEGVEDWKPLVRFYEKVMDNPQKHSREQLYGFLDEHDFPITPDGDIVAYKGVEYRPELDVHTSTHQGVAWVDGVLHTGYTPYPIGAVVTMPRNQVAQNPTEACSAGLHAATFDYANGYGTGILEVHINPRDVVSVPTGTPKIRCCRLQAIQFIEKEYDDVVVYDFEIYEDGSPSEEEDAYLTKLEDESYAKWKAENDENDFSAPTVDLFCPDCGSTDVFCEPGCDHYSDEDEDIEDGPFWSDEDTQFWADEKTVENNMLKRREEETADLDAFWSDPEDSLWDRIVNKAKKKKKGIPKVAEKEGLILVGDDPKDRASYIRIGEDQVPPTPEGWEAIVKGAKQQKKSIQKHAERSGFTLIGDDPKVRSSYHRKESAA
jgi:hypothetical protein